MLRSYGKQQACSTRIVDGGEEEETYNQQADGKQDKAGDRCLPGHGGGLLNGGFLFNFCCGHAAGAIRHKSDRPAGRELRRADILSKKLLSLNYFLNKLSKAARASLTLRDAGTAPAVTTRGAAGACVPSRATVTLGVIISQLLA